LDVGVGHHRLVRLPRHLRMLELVQRHLAGSPGEVDGHGQPRYLVHGVFERVDAHHATLSPRHHTPRTTGRSPASRTRTRSARLPTAIPPRCMSCQKPSGSPLSVILVSVSIPGPVRRCPVLASSVSTWTMTVADRSGYSSEPASKASRSGI